VEDVRCKLAYCQEISSGEQIGSDNAVSPHRCSQRLLKDEIRGYADGDPLSHRK
jgi:hypothetical protein